MNSNTPNELFNFESAHFILHTLFRTNDTFLQNNNLKTDYLSPLYNLVDPPTDNGCTQKNWGRGETR